MKIKEEREYTESEIYNKLGITREVLREYRGDAPKQKKQAYLFVCPKEKIEGKRKIRVYTSSDIERIVYVKLFVEMGYSLNEIQKMCEDNKYDYRKSLSERISKLEAKKRRLDNVLGVAKMLKLTGKKPKYDFRGDLVSFDEFFEKCSAKWNYNNDQSTQVVSKIIEEELPSEEELTNFKKYLNADNDYEKDLITRIQILTEMLFRLDSVPPSDPVPQKIIDGIHSAYAKLLFKPNQFARLLQPMLIGNSDISYYNQKELEKEKCKYFLEALKFFAKNYLSQVKKTE